ncbi:MAG: Rrf2 family transcriptional regulator [Oscillospiraceae bacterium]|nr:Rrf2 family transcriptional regulator [Oscillospiraceae bacterium]
MKISAKSRYALAALVRMGQQNAAEDTVTVSSLAGHLGISKIYLEQVFALLKRGGLVTSTKGAQGGYQLARPPRDINVHDIFSATETALFEPADTTVKSAAPDIESAMQRSFAQLDVTVAACLKNIALETLISHAQEHSGAGHMYYL